MCSDDSLDQRSHLPAYRVEIVEILYSQRYNKIQVLIISKGLFSELFLYSKCLFIAVFTFSVFADIFPAISSCSRMRSTVIKLVAWLADLGQLQPWLAELFQL